MKQFKTDIEGAFAQPLSLNIYDSEFYSQVSAIVVGGEQSHLLK